MSPGLYEARMGPVRVTCLSCARCFLYCPYEQERRGLIGPEELKEIEVRAEEKRKDETQRNVK